MCHADIHRKGGVLKRPPAKGCKARAEGSNNLVAWYDIFRKLLYSYLCAYLCEAIVICSNPEVYVQKGYFDIKQRFQYDLGGV